MRTVYKCQLSVKADVRIEMRKGARVLRVECQDQQPCVWAEVAGRTTVETVGISGR